MCDYRYLNFIGQTDEQTTLA